MRYRANARPLNTEHFRQKFLSERQVVASGKITCPQQPAGEPRLDVTRSMHTVDCYGFESPHPTAQVIAFPEGCATARRRGRKEATITAGQILQV
jgi:hypothetical protein